jgi:hypothetical protein
VTNDEVEPVEDEPAKAEPGLALANNELRSRLAVYLVARCQIAC